MEEKKEFRVILSYGLKSSVVEIKMFAENLADVLMCARGWLQNSHGATDVHVYDVDGFCLGAYAW